MRIFSTSDRLESLRSPTSRELLSSGFEPGSKFSLTFTVTTEPDSQLSIPALVSVPHVPRTRSRVMGSSPRLRAARSADFRRENLGDDDHGELDNEWC